MPYCSIEEAWGNDFYENETESRKFKKIVTPENELNMYDSEVNNDKTKDIKKKKTFSRTYNRLPNHSGPKTRLPINKLFLKKSEKNKKIEIESEYEDDTESKNENEDKDIDININENDLNSELINDESIENFYSENLNNNKENYMNYLLNENKNLKNIIKKYKKNGTEYENIFDLILFLSFGIFLIFILDIISKSVRRLTL